MSAAEPAAVLLPMRTATKESGLHAHHIRRLIGRDAVKGVAPNTPGLNESGQWLVDVESLRDHLVREYPGSKLSDRFLEFADARIEEVNRQLAAMRVERDDAQAGRELALQEASMAREQLIRAELKAEYEGRVERLQTELEAANREIAKLRQAVQLFVASDS